MRVSDRAEFNYIYCTYPLLVRISKKASSGCAAPGFPSTHPCRKPRSAGAVSLARNLVSWPQIEPFQVDFVMGGPPGCPRMSPCKKKRVFRGILFSKFPGAFSYQKSRLFNRYLSIYISIYYMWKRARNAGGVFCGGYPI